MARHMFLCAMQACASVFRTSSGHREATAGAAVRGAELGARVVERQRAAASGESLGERGTNKHH